MSLIGHALRMANKYYRTETYDHVLRVAAYVAENPMIPESKMDDCIALAIMHDLRKDTKYPEYDVFLDERITTCLELLLGRTKNNYIKYIQRIKENAYVFPEAYWVKLADIKDHLSQVDTLTDELKEKYLSTLQHLL